MKQKHKDFLFYVVIISLVEILCAVGLMRLAVPLYLKEQSSAQLSMATKQTTTLLVQKTGIPLRGDR